MSVSLDRRELDLAVQALDKDKFVNSHIHVFFFLKYTYDDISAELMNIWMKN